jgi:hypothetical protein
MDGLLGVLSGRRVDAIEVTASPTLQRSPSYAVPPWFALSVDDPGVYAPYRSTRSGCVPTSRRRSRERCGVDGVLRHGLPDGPGDAVKVLLALLAVLGLGWAFFTQVVGTHITDCGFDATGAYAKVRVNNLLGSSAHKQRVYVDFYLKGSPVQEGPYSASFTFVSVPAHGRGTSVAHGRFPLHGSFGNPTADDLHVKGRTVYVAGRHFGSHGRPSFGPTFFVDNETADPHLVSKKYAVKHKGGVSIETVPDDPNSLRCEITGDGW